jgi:RNA polymerase sigma-70 factor (ECF subfamily)
VFEAGADDAATVREVLAGDRERFGVLVERYQDRIHNFLLRLTRDPARAEDLTQETFFSAYRALAQYQPARPFRSWLFKIAQNCAYQWFRHQGASPDRGPAGEGCVEQAASPLDRPSEVVAKGALFGVVERALAGLDVPFRSAVLLRHREDLSLAEVAEALGVPVGTVKSRLSRAYRQLRQELETKGATAP